MSSIKTFVFMTLLSILMMYSPLTPASTPQAFHARYMVTRSGLTLGEMEATLSYQDQQYTYLKLTKANGLAALLSGDTLTERSIGRSQNQVLHSQQYFYEHKNKRKTRRDQFNFQNPTTVNGQYKNKSYQLSVPAETVDPALLELRLMQDSVNGKSLRYSVTEKGKVKEYHFMHQGQETLTLENNQYICEKMHVSRDNGKRQTTIWLAPVLNNLPVKIRHNEKGDIMESSLIHYQQR